MWGLILVGLGMTSVLYTANPIEESQDYTEQLEQARLEQLRLEELRLMEEWRHIVTAAKKISTDKEMQRAMQKTADAIQNLLSIGIKKIAHEVSPAERAKMVFIVQLIQRMVEISNQAIYNGNALEGEVADEMRQIGQTLMILMAPLIALTQDPQFIAEQTETLQNARVRIYNNVKRTVDQLNNDIQSVR